jgi:hypothetical protein
MSRRFILAASVAILVVFLYAVSRQQSRQNSVWVPDDGFSVTLECQVPTEARVGEWVTLDATRRSGPWKPVDKSTVPEGMLPLPKKPAEREDHVAANLTWKAEPDTVRFSVPTLATIDFDKKYRRVMFLEPGTYRLRGITAFPTPGESSWYTVTVLR